ncbi:MAG: protein kinase [Archangium sp.]|nr:protein kinase [Archangium sp.]
MGDLEIVAPLSVDGLAELFLAAAPGGGTLKKFVMLQQLCRPFRDDPEFTQRFLEEARLSAGLTHPNVGRVLKLGRDPGRGDPYLATEFIAGKTLAGLVKVAEEHGFQLPLPLACRIVHDVCLGLQAAHELADASGAALGLVHGDVTPRNVVITFEGRAKLIDLGLSRARRELRLTHPELAKGTLSYISPEQVLGHPIDARTDLFAAATILFELISGRKMFPNELAAPHAVVMERPPAPSTLAPDVPPDLDDAVLKALERNPDQRHASAYDFACAIAAAVPLAPTSEVTELVTRLFAEDQRATQALLATLAADDPDEATLYAWLSRWEGEGVSHQPPPVRPVVPPRAPALAWPAELPPPPEPAAPWPAELAPPAQPPPSASWPAALEPAPSATWSTGAAPASPLHTSTTPAWPSVLAPPPVAPVDSAPADEPLALAPAPGPVAWADEPLAPAAPPSGPQTRPPPPVAWPAELAPPPAGGARRSARSTPPGSGAWPAELSAPPAPAGWPSELSAPPAPAGWPSELSAPPAPAGWPSELSPPPPAAWPAELSSPPAPSGWPKELSPPPPAAWPAELSPPSLAPEPAAWPAELAAPPAAAPVERAPSPAAPLSPFEPSPTRPEGPRGEKSRAEPPSVPAPPRAPGPEDSVPPVVPAATPAQRARVVAALVLLLIAVGLAVAWYRGALSPRRAAPPQLEEPVR